MEGLAARAHKPLSVQPSMADTVTDAEALVWKIWRQAELFMEKDGGIEK